jgi:cyanophycinase
VTEGPLRSPPLGFLVAIGGNEDKEFGKAVLKQMCELPAGGTRHVEVIPTASQFPDQMAVEYRKAFGALGIPKVEVMDIRDRRAADLQEYVDRVRDCDVVFFTGGDQLRLTTLLGGTAVAAAIRHHHRNGGVVAGTSAGAAAMSATMIFEGEPNRGMRKGSVQMTPGLGLISKAVLDTHFLDRGRLSRLLEVVASNPGLMGVGLGEDTGIIVRHGEELEVFGKGVVVLVDGHDLRYTNLTDIALHEPIAVENITVHTLVAGHGFHLGERRYLRPPPQPVPLVPPEGATNGALPPNGAHAVLPKPAPSIRKEPSNA